MSAESIASSDVYPPPLKKHKVLEKDEALRLRKEYIAPSLSLHYSKVKPLKILSGKGQYLYDENEQPYLDCINNVTHVGHCHPKVVKACSEQMAKVCCNPFPNHHFLEKYTSHLLTKFPDKLDFVFYTNSGSEANDLALQIAEAATGHTEVIAIEGAYHGHTQPLMGLSSYKLQQQKEGDNKISANPHAWLAPLPDPYRGLYRNRETAGQQYADEVKKIIDRATEQGKKVASFLCESFLGCAGQVKLPDGYFKAVFDYVHEAGGLCILDEVQTGFGRAGNYFWIFESQDVCPDMVTIGKPMGNGHPISAVVTTSEIAAKFVEAEGLESLEEFCSDPVSLAIAEAVLTTIEEEGLQENAKKLGTYIMDGLKRLMEKHPCIGDVRGFGLFIGFELVKNRDNREPNGPLAIELIQRVMLKHRILLMNDGLDHNVIKIKPPLCFTKDNADAVLQAIDETLGELLN